MADEREPLANVTQVDSYVEWIRTAIADLCEPTEHGERGHQLTRHYLEYVTSHAAERTLEAFVDEALQ